MLNFCSEVKYAEIIISLFIIKKIYNMLELKKEEYILIKN